MLTVKINGVEYPLASTLRVAYKVQGQHNHKPYTEIFNTIGEMHLEDQVGLLYAAFECANPSEVFTIKQQDFLNAYLDTYNLKDMMGHIKTVIAGIMGEDLSKASEKESPGATNSENENEKN